MPTPVEDFCALLIRSRLHSVEQVKGLYQQWQSVGRRPGQLDDFRAWLVARNYLTAYQAELLQNGHADNFFLNRYKILERIGKGRMAGVYKAAGPKDQVVAVKVLPPSRAKDHEHWGRFQREIRLAMQLSHPAIVRTFDYGKVNNLCFLVMEFLDGVTLEAVLARHGRLSPRETARLGFLTCLGLQHIADRGMVHRDLKPGNLMLTPAPAPQENTLRSMVKILDIGLGRILFDPNSQAVTEALTSDGDLLGSPDYLAPEQARDPRKVDIRADLYSLGCTLYHALTGEAPFKDTNLVRQILRHATQHPRRVRELNPEVPEALERIVLKLLAKDPGHRYASPAATGAALKGFLAS